MSTETKYLGVVIPSEYGGFQFVPTAPSREPPRVEPPMTTAAICKKYKLTKEQFEWCRVHPLFPSASFTGTHNLTTSVVTQIAVRDAVKVAEFFETAHAVFGGQ
jgi:hypothetical protein